MSMLKHEWRLLMRSRLTVAALLLLLVPAFPPPLLPVIASL